MTTVLARGRAYGAGLAAILALALAGCGGDDGGDSTSAGASTQAPASTQAGGDSGGDSGDSGSGGGGGDFCQQLENVDDAITTAPDPTNAGDVAKTFDEAAAALDEVSPPAEIEEDWGTLVSTFRGWADAFEGIDLSDPEALAGAQDALSAIEDSQEELLAATERISEYAADACGIQLPQSG